LVGKCYPILIQQNLDGSDFFNRTWREYRAGFGDPSGNYWLGNGRLSGLTRSKQYKLHIDLQCERTGQWYVAEYSTFTVGGEADHYRLKVAGFSGTARQDALIYHSGMQFSAKDIDNDQWPAINCAASRGGGFWYRSCGYCNVNTMRRKGKGDSFGWYKLPGGQRLRTSRMWLLCR
jgi:hypothetical protein